MDALLGLPPASAAGAAPAPLSINLQAPIYQIGIVLDWEDAPTGDISAPTMTTYARLAYVRPNNARGTTTVHWPLPEAGWIDGSTTVLVRHPIYAS